MITHVLLLTYACEVWKKRFLRGEREREREGGGRGREVASDRERDPK